MIVGYGKCRAKVARFELGKPLGFPGFKHSPEPWQAPQSEGSSLRLRLRGKSSGAREKPWDFHGNIRGI